MVPLVYRALLIGLTTISRTPPVTMGSRRLRPQPDERPLARPNWSPTKATRRGLAPPVATAGGRRGPHPDEGPLARSNWGATKATRRGMAARALTMAKTVGSPHVAAATRARSGAGADTAPRPRRRRV